MLSAKDQSLFTSVSQLPADYSGITVVPVVITDKAPSPSHTHFNSTNTIREVSTSQSHFSISAFCDTLKKECWILSWMLLKSKWLLPLTGCGQMTPAPRFKHIWLLSWGHWEILSSVPTQFAFLITVGGGSGPALVSIATTLPTACACCKVLWIKQLDERNPQGKLTCLLHCIPVGDKSP